MKLKDIGEVTVADVQQVADGVILQVSATVLGVAILCGVTAIVWHYYKKRTGRVSAHSYKV